MKHYGTENVTTNLKQNVPSARYYQLKNICLTGLPAPGFEFLMELYKIFA